LAPTFLRIATIFLVLVVFLKRKNTFFKKKKNWT
jgi:hypothetical protein